ncbi:inositol-phosphate phosphatase, partial [Xanthomonas arboricola pv. pruni str. MAFF 311562]
MQKPAVTVMVKAARLAGNVLLRGINKLDALNVVQKGRMDYASEVDADAEKVIIKELKRGYPEYAVFGEEGGVQGGKSGRYTWVIDPLDGTSNYLRGFPHYCVSIALVENGEPTDAVIFDPLRNELFTASRGAGAVLNDRRIRIAERKDLEGAMVHTGFPPRERARISAQLKCVDALLVQAEDVRRTGSAALDLAYVACGRADAYFEAGVKAGTSQPACCWCAKPVAASATTRAPPRRAWTTWARKRSRSWPATSRSATRCRRSSSTPATPASSTPSSDRCPTPSSGRRPHNVGARPSATGLPQQSPRDQGRSYDSAQQTNKAGIAPGLVRSSSMQSPS